MEQIGYNSLWRAIIRPPRADYETKDLGPEKFLIHGSDNQSYKVQRTDFTLQNARGADIVCSHFEPYEEDRQWENLPCVIYMHGNSSCRMEALETVHYLLPQNITMFCFDFAGCGNSGGEYISLGWWERDDVAMIVDHLREQRRVNTLALWGRSMGAVTALLHADRDPSIAALVLDSPFSNLSKLVNELAYTYTKLPSFLVSPALKLVASTIKSKANFDIYKLSPIDHVQNSFIPALFATATGDDFIQPHHSQMLHDAYQGDKNFIKFEGDHNTARPQFFYDSASIFLFTTLQCDQLLSPETKFSPEVMLARKNEIRRKKKEQKQRELQKEKERLAAEKPNMKQKNLLDNYQPAVKVGDEELDDLGSGVMDAQNLQGEEEESNNQLAQMSNIMANPNNHMMPGVAPMQQMDEDPELAAAIAASLEQMGVEEQIRQIEKNTSQNVNQEEEKKQNPAEEDYLLQLTHNFDDLDKKSIPNEESSPEKDQVGQNNNKLNKNDRIDQFLAADPEIVLGSKNKQQQNHQNDANNNQQQQQAPEQVQDLINL